MSLSQYLKVNVSSLYKMTGLTVFIFVMLQLAVWYPQVSDAKDEADRRLNRKEQMEAEWRQIQGQANRLKEAKFISAPWVNYRIESESSAVPTQWLLDGSARSVEWKNLLEGIEEHIALGLQSVHWERLSSGEWHGRLLFYIEAPRTNREYHNWLPIKLRSNDFVEKDWKILSTMAIGEKTSALLEHKQQRYWVHQGSWLPSAGLTVDVVTFEQVTLLAKDGSQIVLTLREKGDKDD